jgi:hypothetical protein
VKDHARIIAEEIAHSERTRDVPPAEGAIALRSSSEGTSMYSLRLRHETIAELNALAERYDVPPSSLARGFLLEGLANSAHQAAAPASQE